MPHMAWGPEPPEPPPFRFASRPAPGPAIHYIHAAGFCFALVLLDDGIPPSIRLVVSLFGDANSAERFALDHGYHRYVIAPAAPVLAVVSIA